MEESWRFRPIQGNICPSCSISHFPFCPQPLPYDRNMFGGDSFHRLPNDPSFRRPYFDPFLDNRAMPRPLPQFDNHVNSVRPIPGNPNDAYGTSQSLNGNQNLERDPFRKFPVPSQMADPSMFNGIRRDGFQQPPSFGYVDNGFMRGEFSESDRSRKRMRVHEMGASSLSQMPPPIGGFNSNPTRISLEDERRLNLIRDHGTPSNVEHSHGGLSLGSVRGGLTEQENRLNEYFHENSLGDRAKFDESRITDWQPMLHKKTRINNIHDPMFGSIDRVGSMLHPETVIDPLYHVKRDKVRDDKKELHSGEHGSGFVQQQIQSSMNGFQSAVDDAMFRSREGSGMFTLQKEQRQHSHYGQIDNTSLQGHEPSNVPTGASFYVNPSQQSQDLSNRLREDVNCGDHSFSTSQKGDLNHPHIPHHAQYAISQDSHENYHAHDFQPLFPRGFNPEKELQYSRMAISQVSSGLNTPYHENNHNLNFHGLQSDVRQSYEVEPPPSVGPHNVGALEQCVASNVNKQGAYLPMSTGNIMPPTRQGQVPAPPLPPLPPPPLPVDPPGPPPSHLHTMSSLPKTSFSVYPIPASSSAAMPLLHSSSLEGQPKPSSPEKPKVIDASRLFRQPHSASRPDHIVIILRGLPGSGKSYLAKMLRDLEVENGGNAPRIHSMDDYFMTEVEKVEESESSKFSGSVKGKKKITKKVMEYCYEPEMEEAYRSSMLKAFKKTLEEGNFTFIIVDDRNLRVADFAQFWACAKRLGYEVYLLEATYKDPVGCAARNVHGFSSEDIQKMAELWEEAPPLYLQLDIQSLFHGDDLEEHGIQEVDMDMEDMTCDEGPSGSCDSNSLRTMETTTADSVSDGTFKDRERWDTEGDDPTGVNELGRSKWSHDVDEEDIEKPNGAKGNLNALSGLIQAYSKGDKSVHWGDQVGKTGFSIGAAKKANVLSLVIGPGAGYNLKSNPLLEEENVVAAEVSWESKRRSVFQEQLRAERESFRAVFDRRRQRIGGFEMEDE